MFNKLCAVRIASSLLLIASTLFAVSKIADVSPATANEKATTGIDRVNPNLVSLSARKAKRPRIAVLNFQFNSIGTSELISSWLKTNVNAVTDLMIDKLVDGGNFSVIERTRINQVLQEQNFGQTGRVDANSAAKIGRILGVQTILIGSVTEFNLDRQSSGFNIPLFGGIGSGGSKLTANVKISMRAVDTKTGEILFTAQGVGSSDHNDSSVSIRGFSTGSGSSSQELKLISTATADAVEQIATKINKNPSKLIDTP
jgi:curli biogenesis system outer membrane secretion channel CsgG